MRNHPPPWLDHAVYLSDGAGRKAQARCSKTTYELAEGMSMHLREREIERERERERETDRQTETETEIYLP